MPKKDAYYFSHDSNASNDEKILNLRVEHDWYGYGLYWAVIEQLRNANAYRLQCNYKAIAYNLHCESKVIESIINDFDLFVINDNYFFSESLNHRMKLKEDKSQKARDSANKRWLKNANALQPHSDRNASKVKEKKEKESKVNNNSKRAQAIERILKAYPRVDLHNAALLSVGYAIQREVDKGHSEDETIIMLEDSVKKYTNSLDDVKFATKACKWFDGGGYLSVVSKNESNQKDESNRINEADAIAEHMKNWEPKKIG